jgi:thiamine kinase-like enzyme
MIKLVDWELAGLGDPSWDVGTVFSEYLNLWLVGTPMTIAVSPEESPILSRYSLARMQPAIRAFWQSYVRQVELEVAKTNERLLRAVRFAGVKLVQNAYEQMQFAPRLTARAVHLLQLSFNVLKRPEEAAVQLLGVPSL